VGVGEKILKKKRLALAQAGLKKGVCSTGSKKITRRRNGSRGALPNGPPNGARGVQTASRWGEGPGTRDMTMREELKKKETAARQQGPTSNAPKPRPHYRH